MNRNEFKYPKYLNAAYYLVDENANKWGDRVAIYYDRSVITYSKLEELVNRLGNGLRSLGISPGDRYLCRFPNVPEAAISFLAGMKIGAIPIPSFPYLKEKEVEYILKNSEAKVIITTADAVNEIEGIKNKCATLEQIVTAGDTGGKYLSFEGLLEAGSPDLEAAETTRDDLAFLCYTSGTTGTPKGLPHRHESVLFQTDTVVNFTLKLTTHDVVYNPAPFGFSFGLTSLILMPFRYGSASVFVPDRLEGEEVLELVERYGITVLKLNATQAAKLLDIKNPRERFHLKSLRVVTCGASSTSNHIFREFEKTFGMRLQLGYGLQEIIGSSHGCPLGDGRPDTIGKTMDGWTAKVIGQDGKEVARGNPGTLFIKGNSIIPYYWKDPDRTKEYLREGWLKTDDIVYEDSEGFFHFVARSDDMIISSGWSISPREIEEAMLEHPAVAEVAVFGIEDSIKSNIPVAIVTPKANYKPSDELEEEIKKFVKMKLAPFKYPRKIKFSEAIPKTPTGKIVRNVLKDLWNNE